MATIQKWGNSLAVRIPATLADRVKIGAGTPVEVTAENGAILVKPSGRRKYRLKELLKDCKPGQLHGEMDIGPDCSMMIRFHPRVRKS